MGPSFKSCAREVPHRLGRGIVGRIHRFLRLATADLDQLEAQRLDLGEQAEEGRLVGHRPGEQGLAIALSGAKAGKPASNVSPRSPRTRISNCMFCAESSMAAASPAKG